MSLDMSLNLNDLKDKPIIGANLRINDYSISLYIHIEDKELHERMRKDESLVKKFIKEYQEEIETFLIGKLKVMCGSGGDKK